MTMGFRDKDGAMLHDLLEHASGDIVIWLNADGFIDHASESLANLGINLSQSLFEPHIADLAEPAFVGQLKRHVDRALENEANSEWFEFPVQAGLPEDEYAQMSARCWFALSVRRLVDENGNTQGGLGLLRSVDRIRRLEDELFANALTDPFTGLVKRQVFHGRLREALDDGAEGYLAVFAIDRMRALFMQYGQRTADEINWGFAKFLQSMALPGTEVAQIDGERFSVMLAGVPAQGTRRWVDDLIQTFASLTLPSSGKSPQLTASAGLAKIEKSVDWTMRQAELALIMARAGGGNRAAQSGGPVAARLRQAANQDDVFDDRLGVRTRRR